MKLCRRLLTEINFEPKSIAPCCAVRNIKIPNFPYSGGEIDLDAYGKHIGKTLEEIQSGSSVCRNCPELYEANSPPALDGKFHAISINMHRYFCNCKCVYCSLWNKAEKGKGYDILPGLRSLYNQGAMHKNCFVSWGGGEPSILPQFEDASSWLLDEGFYQNIHSNALIYSPAIAKILAADRGKINISLDSSSKNIYRTVKGLDAFEKVKNNIISYAKHGAKNIVLKYIIFEKNNNFEEISNFLILAKKLGIEEVELSLNFLEINSNTVSEKTLLAASLFNIKAQQLGIPKINNFYIDPEWKKRIQQTALKYSVK